MRRLFIIRKDLHLSSGKLAAMVSHCAEAYWISLIKQGINPLIVIENYNDRSRQIDNYYDCNITIRKDVVDNYLFGTITKTICEAKNLNKLNEAKAVAESLGLIENVDFGFIDDNCYTELTPEFYDENGQGHCRVGIWFRPLDDEISHTISKKYKLYKD